MEWCWKHFLYSQKAGEKHGSKACCSQLTYTRVVRKLLSLFLLEKLPTHKLTVTFWAGVERSWPFGLAYQSSSDFVCSAYIWFKMLPAWPRLLCGEVFQYLSFLMDRFISTDWMPPKLHPSIRNASNLAVEVLACRRLDGQGTKARNCSNLGGLVSFFPGSHTTNCKWQDAQMRQFGLFREAPAGFLHSMSAVCLQLCLVVT